VAGFGAIAAVLVFSLGVSGCGAFFGSSEAESEGGPAPEEPRYLLFSGESWVSGDSAVDLIAAAAEEAPLFLPLASGSETVSLGETGRDLGTGGLVLRRSGGPETYTSPADVTIDGGGRTVQWNEETDQTLITVGQGVTLTLKNITFQGTATPIQSITAINVDGGKLIFETGAVIKDFHRTNGGGTTGVYVAGGGTFIMSGGEISGNSSGNKGVGVRVGTDSEPSGLFIKTGGVIYGSDAGDKSNGDNNLGCAIYVGGASGGLNKGRKSTAGEGPEGSLNSGIFDNWD
jgi:hypothetical protein